MKPTALFINNGRGPTVEESGLIKALQEGWIAAAGLDVFEQEPPDPENPLLHMGQRDPDSPRGLGLAADGPRDSEAGWPGDIAGVVGPLAPDLRQSVGTGKDRSSPMAAILHGAGARFLAPTVGGNNREAGPFQGPASHSFSR